MVNGDNKRKQIYKIIWTSYLFLIKLFLKQTNKLNSENWLEV